MPRLRHHPDPDNPKPYASYFRCSQKMERAIAELAEGALSKSDVARICIDYVLNLPSEERKAIFYKGMTREIL